MSSWPSLLITAVPIVAIWVFAWLIAGPMVALLLALPALVLVPVAIVIVVVRNRSAKQR